MASAAPAPIAGTPIDPPPRPVPGYAERLERTRVGRVAHRALRRYSAARVGLLANGTAYYLFLAMFAVLAFAFGIAALVGADAISRWLTEAMNEALPGVIGDEGIDPETLQRTGRTAGIVGLLVLLYSGTGAVGGATSSLHLIFGAPPDARKFLVAKLRAIAILLLVGPLLVVSFAAGELARALLGAPWLGVLLGFGVDVLILWILLGTLGGIRPHPRPRLVAALLGAIAVGVVKLLLTAIMAWAIARPQYGAFAAPIAVLFILQLLSLVLYASACVAAGISDAAVPLEELDDAPEVRVEQQGRAG
jgi:membrane protein